MVDQALPRSDRIITDEEQAEIDAAADRLSLTLREEAASEPPPRDASGAIITLQADEWRRLTSTVLASPPLVDRVIKAIRKQAGQQTGRVAIAGSLHGWNALLNYLLNRGICCDLGAAISAQTTKGNQAK